MFGDNNNKKNLLIRQTSVMKTPMDAEYLSN